MKNAKVSYTTLRATPVMEDGIEGVALGEGCDACRVA